MDQILVGVDFDLVHVDTDDQRPAQTTVDLTERV